MKLIKLTLLSFSLSLAISSLAHAGGVTCKECPAESDKCAPKPGCSDSNPSLKYSQTLHCIQAGLPKTEFTIQENQPYTGQALITSQRGQSQTVRFTFNLERVVTHKGPIQKYQKVFFHPYFEYNLNGEVNLYDAHEAEELPVTYDGAYLAEQNQHAEVSCKVISQKLNR